MFCAGCHLVFDVAPHTCHLEAREESQKVYPNQDDDYEEHDDPEYEERERDEEDDEHEHEHED